MKKNSQIQIRLETESLNKLRQQSIDCGISISELIRQKVKNPPQLTRIEQILERMDKKLFDLLNAK